MAFDPKKHLIKVQGGRDYLPVAQRLVWFREDHPDWGLETKPILIEAEKGIAIYHAMVYNQEGRLMACGTKMETMRGFHDYVEKAETGAVGRALAMCGYGTQFAPELDEGDRIVDAPMPMGTPTRSQSTNESSRPIGRPVSEVPNLRIEGTHGGAFSELTCSDPDCSRELTKAQHDYSQRVFGSPLCPTCQKKHPRLAGDNR
jgi:hypothetical protein